MVQNDEVRNKLDKQLKEFVCVLRKAHTMSNALSNMYNVDDWQFDKLVAISDNTDEAIDDVAKMIGQNVIDMILYD